jgi:hypothetical protein
MPIPSAAFSTWTSVARAPLGVEPAGQLLLGRRALDHCHALARKIGEARELRAGAHEDAAAVDVDGQAEIDFLHPP